VRFYTAAGLVDELLEAQEAHHLSKIAATRVAIGRKPLSDSFGSRLNVAVSIPHQKTGVRFDRPGASKCARHTINQRQGDHDTRTTQLRFIKQAQTLGFTLEEIGEMLALQVDTETSCDKVRHRAEHKVADVTAKIRSLQAIRGALKELIVACARGCLEGECPFFASLEQHMQERINP